MAPKIMVINGPNLNLLGSRQPQIYGPDTLGDIKKICRKKADKVGFEVDFRQSNVEGEMVGWLHEAKGNHIGIVLNAAAYTHTSIALMDAIAAIELPVVEVHLSNIHSREKFRHHSFISKVVIGQICGFGPFVYELAIDALADNLNIT